MVLLDYILVPGLLYLIAGVAMNSIVGAVPVWVWVAVFVVLNTLVNYLGIEFTARVNKLMLIAELIVLAIFVVVGVVALAGGAGRGFGLSPVFDASTFSFGLIFGAVSIAVLSFLGFDGIFTLAEENRESARTIGKATIGALARIFRPEALSWSNTGAGRCDGAILPVGCDSSAEVARVGAGFHGFGRGSWVVGTNGASLSRGRRAR
jgi:amino acid transporter